LLDDIQAIETDNHLGSEMGITVMSPEHWPLFWYLRGDPNVAYEGNIVSTKQPVVIALDKQADELEKKLGQDYLRVSTHSLRPGVTLVLYLRRDLVL
jgi:hypothetical protein